MEGVHLGLDVGRRYPRLVVQRDAVASGEGDAKAEADGRPRDHSGDDDHKREQEEVIPLPNHVFHCIRSTAKSQAVRNRCTRIATVRGSWGTHTAGMKRTTPPR